jgi:hypothetical protein
MRLPSLLPLLFPFAAALAACSSTSPASPGDAGPAAATCPAAPPVAGTPCSVASGCEYAPDGNRACTTIARCEGITSVNPTSTWQVTEPAASCGVNPTSCPATFTARAVGTACDPTSAPTCDYAQGRCACGPCLGGSAAQGLWACVDWSTGGEGCPAPRPLLGSACTAAQEGVHCSYDFACTGVPNEGPDMECASGRWSDVEVPAAECGAPAACISDAGTD